MRTRGGWKQSCDMPAIFVTYQKFTSRSQWQMYGETLARLCELFFGSISTAVPSIKSSCNTDSANVIYPIVAEAVLLVIAENECDTFTDSHFKFTGTLICGDIAEH